MEVVKQKISIWISSDTLEKSTSFLCDLEKNDSVLKSGEILNWKNILTFKIFFW